jgi:glyoxylase-like metal-dependent hydrolase (beta-lactamase superfamily II)
MKITDSLHAFIWNNPRANNANTYLLMGSKIILIDPGHIQLFDHVIGGLLRLGLAVEQVDVVLVTHTHIDHIEAARMFRKPTLLTMSREGYQYVDDYGSGTGYEPDFFLKEGSLNIGDIALQVIPTPGHMPGSLSFYWPDRKALFTGDVIFNQSIGRTDLPGGSGKLLKESIRRLASLEVEYLLSGHGNAVMGKKAVQDNFQMVADYWFSYLD